MTDRIPDDGPLNTPIGWVFSRKLADAIRRKGNLTTSTAQVVRDLLNPEKVQTLLRLDAAYLNQHTSKATSTSN